MQVLFQSEASECGIACIAMLASAHGFSIDLTSMRARYPVSLKGSTLQNIVEIASDIGLESRAIRCEINDLKNLQLPAILHWNMKHFVVLVKCKRNSYVILDPAFGRIKVSKEDINRSFTGVALEAWPGPDFKKDDVRNRLEISRIIPKSLTIRKVIISIFLYAITIELIILFLPILQQIIIDDALVTQDTDLLLLLTITTAVFMLGKAITEVVRGLVQRNLSSSLSLIVPSHVFKHMAGLSVSWFEKRSSADIITRFDSVNQIHTTLTTTTINAIIDGIVALLTLAAMFLYSSTLATIVLIFTGIYAAIRLFWFRFYRLHVHNEIVQRARVTQYLMETIQGIATIKIFGGALQRQDHFLGRLSRHIVVKMQIKSADIYFAFTQSILTGAERVGVIFLGAHSVLEGNFTVGMLIAFLSFRDNYVRKTDRLIDAVVAFKMLDVHLDRTSDILLTPQEHKTELPYLGEKNTKGAIEIKNVSYKYGENDVFVLRNCNLKIEAGKTIAIVGPSGSGKSTLYKVLAGEAEPQVGQVLIDDVPITTIGYERLRQIIAVVRQNDMLFGGTVFENIALLDPIPNHDKVYEVARTAQIFDEIEHMPMGFNTLVGAMGSGLSGGQLQRLMIARALYRDPQILILDEATSSLDVENEKKITAAISELGITRIIIAHRQETIASADKIIDIRDINYSVD